MAATMAQAAWELLKRETVEGDPEDHPKEGEKELSSSLALFILISLLIVALFTSYILQTRKVQAVHETVLSIFGGMVVGFVLRVSGNQFILNVVSFDYQFFFNLLLPPIILASGYELHQGNFFRYIGPILTFAFAGTFISAVVLGVLLWLFTRVALDGLNISFVDAFSVGATLSATDPVTILAIFNAYKVDPKLYTIIFGESILNDAIAIVLFETAQKYVHTGVPGEQTATLSIGSLFEAIGIFLLVFFGSCLIGIVVGIGTTLGLKFTHVRRFPKTETCLIVLIAYASYFFSTAIHMSGIVALLFCGITLKHYAYYNMSRRTQLATKFVFQTLAQLSENFIFIYLGLTLFTDSTLTFKPPFIITTMLGVCAARYVAVFPLSGVINWVIRLRAKKKGQAVADELPNSYQVMLFWAGLRGAVGVALAAGLKGSENNSALRATVLVVVVLTVIIFGGTTARMLEIMNIQTGVVEEVDSDDEFDIETVANGTYYKRGGTAFGHTPTRSDFTIRMDNVNGRANSVPHSPWDENGYSSGSNKGAGSNRPGGQKRAGSTHSQLEREEAARALLRSNNTTSSGLTVDDDSWGSDSDLPPAAPRRSPKRRPSPPHEPAASRQPQILHPYPTSGTAHPHSHHTHNQQTGAAGDSHLTAREVIKDFFTGTEEPSEWFKRLDDALIKPTLLLDQSSKGAGPSGTGGGPGSSSGNAPGASGSGPGAGGSAV